jgi:hypothetical protein
MGDPKVFENRLVQLDIEGRDDGTSADAVTRA